MTFGKNLQSLRKEKGLSQDALANQLYVTRQSVSQWENDRTMPSVDLLIKLSEIFDTTVDALLGKPETESIPQPTAKVGVLKDKKGIITALRYEYATVAIVLFSLALLFAAGAAVILFIENNLYSLTVAVRIKNDFLGAWQPAVGAALFLIAAAVFSVIGFISERTAVKFGREHSCTLSFYYDHLVIEEDGLESLSLFYTNVKRIVETDGYFVFKMQNKAKLCVDKNDVENAEGLSQLLRSAKNYLDRRLCKSPTGMGRIRRCVIRFFRDFLFVSTFATPWFFSLIFAILCAIITENQLLRIAVFAIPFAVLLVELAAGVLLTIGKVKAKRMIIAGAAGIVFLSAYAFMVNYACTVYNFQHDRVTSERFIEYMESHGMTIENTIEGRQELFLSNCYTATSSDNRCEILFLEFDEYSPQLSLFSAREAYGAFENKIRSQPRMTTRYATQDLGFNGFYTEITNNHYAYVSLNEFSVIYVETTPENEAAVKETLSDFELMLPY